MGRKRTKPILTTNTIDKLCDLVNNKYNLHPNEIGSIEYHSDTCESSVVQICNQYRGVRQLICGSEPVLRKYLQNILEDKTILNFWNIN